MTDLLRIQGAIAESDTQLTAMADNLAMSRALVAGLRANRLSRKACRVCDRTITDHGQEIICRACEEEIDRDLAVESLRSAVEVLGVCGSARELQRMAGVRITVGGAT